MDEKQLSVAEQRQVYDSIKNDYENLLKTYAHAKKNDPNGFLPNELDLDMYVNYNIVCFQILRVIFLSSIYFYFFLKQSKKFCKI
jgi:hypothetical protein